MSLVRHSNLIGTDLHGIHNTILSASPNGTFTVVNETMVVATLSVDDITINLPASPVDGRTIIIYHSAGNILTVSGNGNTIQPVNTATDTIAQNKAKTYVYISDLGDWYTTNVVA